jgi:hypothetical protein
MADESLLATMSAMPTTSVLRGGGITHLLAGIMRRSHPVVGLDPSKPVDTVVIANHQIKSF